MALNADRSRSLYCAEVSDAIEPFLARCAKLHTATSLPFHSPHWLRAWYATFGRSDGRRPLLVSVQHRHSGADAACLPLVVRRRAGLRVVEFADAGVVDYIAPILAPDWHAGVSSETAAAALWQAVRVALRGHDVLHIHKLLTQLPEEAGGHVNPLARVLRTQACTMFGNQFSVPGDWDVWRHTLDKRTRKEIERCWRVFQRSADARFEHITDPARALALFETLEQQQSQRLRSLGVPYALDAPAAQAFYRHLIQQALADPTGANGTVVLTALMDGEHVVSALFGLANGQRYLGLRQSLGGDAWKACSPARLLDEQTARHLHAQGLRHFDFGIGDYHHKQALQMTPIPLLDACVALSWRGVPVVLGWRWRRALKRSAWLVAVVRRLRGKPLPSTA